MRSLGFSTGFRAYALGIMDFVALGIMDFVGTLKSSCIIPERFLEACARSGKAPRGLHDFAEVAWGFLGLPCRHIVHRYISERPD